MKRLILLAALLCSTGVIATNMYWSPTTFEDGTPAVIYLTDELSNACPSGGLCNQ